MASSLSYGGDSASEAAIHVSAFDLPLYSDLLSKETRVGIEAKAALRRKGLSVCDPNSKTTRTEILACEAQYYPPLIAEARKAYSVVMETKIIGGILTDVVTPAEGVPRKNADRVLINIHGGGFTHGHRFLGQLEAMPIAAIGKYKVIAVDYRLAPEHRFPAASIDVAAVYRELLQEYAPSNIGIYGCSAGGRITGQMIGWLEKQGLPRPGALAILCSPPSSFGGDSNVIVAAMQGNAPRTRRFDVGYFKGVRPDDPMAFPGDFDQMLAKFPPSLLMTSTRDYSLGPMVTMHARLVRLGVPTELHVIEGLWHGDFIYVPNIAEARHAANAISLFFDRHLHPGHSRAQEGEG
jgi:acetyl esterase/lipase